MNEVIPFDFDDETVRVVMIADAPWFVANDVAKVLGYRMAPHMTRMLDDDERGIHIVDTGNGQRSATIISESGLFAAILKSRREEAQRFRRWVTGEVLPALRRHGVYRLPGGNGPELAAGASLDFDPPRVQAGVALVREARRLFGPEAARVVWMKYGLPSPIANSKGGDNDVLAQQLREYLIDKAETTIEEAGVGIGLTQIDGGTRLRIGQTLRLLGWHPRKARRGHYTVNLFVPAREPEGGEA